MRNITANNQAAYDLTSRLLLYLDLAGFKVTAVSGEGEYVPLTTIGEALAELRTGLEYIHLKGPSGKPTWLRIIEGNGRDNPSDNGDSDVDGWNAAIDAFIASQN